MRTLLFFIVLLSISFNTFSQTKNKNKGNVLDEEKHLQITNVFIDACKAKILGNLEEAETKFLQCIRLNPLHSASYYEMSILLASKGAFKQSMEYNRKAIELDPNNYWYQLQMASIYQRVGKYNESIKTLEHLIKKQPNNNDLYLETANTYLLANKPNEAITTLNRIEKRIGITPEITLHKKEIFIKQRKITNAIQEIENLSAQYPEETKYKNILAELYFQNKQYTAAESTLLNILQQDPNDPHAYLTLALIQQQQNNLEQAFGYLIKAFENPGTDIDTKINILFSYYNYINAQPDLKTKTFELAETLLQTHPKEAKAHAIYADLLLQNKQYTEARNAFKNVIKFDNTKYIVWEQLLYTTLLIHQYDSLIIESNQALELFPEQSRFYIYKGLALSKLKRHTEAKQTFEEAIAISANNTKMLSDIYTEIGNTLYEAKDYTLSDEAFTKAIELNPNNAYTLNNFSYFLSERNENLENALQMSIKANTLNPNDPAMIDTHGWILYKMGKYTEAEEKIKQALKILDKVEEGTILEHYGDILFKLNRTDEALEYWQRAKQTGETSEWIDKKINDKKLYE